MKYVISILIAPIVIISSLIELLVLCLMLIFLIFKNKDVNQYLYRNFLSIDQRINVWLFGDEDETISSRMGRHLVKKKNCKICIFVCNLLNLIDPNHCIDAIEEDL